MKKSQYGACGLYCGACGATDCGGCRSDRVDETVEKCKFRRCSRERNVEFCGFCGEYPCKELSAFMHDEWPHHGTMEPNLEYIKSMASRRGWRHRRNNGPARPAEPRSSGIRSPAPAASPWRHGTCQHHRSNREGRTARTQARRIAFGEFFALRPPAWFRLPPDSSHPLQPMRAVNHAGGPTRKTPGPKGRNRLTYGDHVKNREPPITNFVAGPVLSVQGNQGSIRWISGFPPARE